jgi:hypothetical protein
MSSGFKHSTLWSFGSVVWHKATKDKGLVIGISLRPDSRPQYVVVFEDTRVEDICYEFELTDEQPVESSNK